MANSSNITADQHNATRRMVKAKQQANRKAAAKGRTVGGPPIMSGGSMFEVAKRERERHLRKLQLQKHNEDRLISIVLTKGILVLTRPTYAGCDEDIEIFHNARRVFERNVADVKRAAKARKAYFHWHETPNGDFCIALPNRA
jgi:hypothetical protein